ncbi:MAG TPA: hypothetical protein VE078_08750 [Thermoanaerobaculia bacterium]|nr:hypothetical protein [Thermoanaerobaculia bacterium]
MTAHAHCFYHPDRSAIAICVACRKPICQACSTLWEGIHHCTACLAQRRAAVGRRGTAVRTIVLGLLTLALLAGVTVLRAWIGAVLMEGF